MPLFTDIRSFFLEYLTLHEASTGQAFFISPRLQPSHGFAICAIVRSVLTDFIFAFWLDSLRALAYSSRILMSNQLSFPMLFMRTSA